MKKRSSVKRLLGIVLAVSLLLGDSTLTYMGNVLASDVAAEDTQGNETATSEEKTESTGADTADSETETADKTDANGTGNHDTDVTDESGSETDGTDTQAETTDESDTAAGNTETVSDAAETADAGDENSVSDEAEIEAAALERAADAEELGYMPGEILVTYKDDVSESEVAQMAEEKDGELVETLAATEEENVAMVSISDNTTVETAVEEYASDPNVAHAEPNYLIESFEDEVSSYAESTQNQWYLDYVHASEAWNILANYNSSKVRVAVIDTGAMLEHEDLTGVINRSLSKEIVKSVSNGAYVYSTIALRGDGYLNGTSTQNTSTAHGTHVSGIIAAQSGNGVGIQGTASGGNTAKKNSIVDLVVIDAFTSKNSKNEDTGTVADVIYAMGYAADQGCRVINLSLGTTSQSSILESVCKALTDEGITIVCAAGNAATDAPVYPCDYSTTIGVININSGGSKSGSSNYGSKKDLSAPGDTIYSTVSGSSTSYGNMSGTSMASPIVAATAAMVLYVNPSLSPARVKDILCSTATDLGASGKDAYTGYGSVNIQAAVEKAGNLDLANATVSAVGAQAATGKAITPEPTVKLEGWTLTKGVDYTLSYSNNVQPGTATITITGKGAFKGTKTLQFEIRNSTGITYRVHAQDYGWMSWVNNKEQSGTTGEAKRLESIEIKLTNPAYAGSIEYRTHLQGYGWIDWTSNGNTSGTIGESRRMEAIQIRLTGEMAEHYDVYYRVHSQTYGWLGWAKNGEVAGSTAYAKRLEAIEIQLLPKGSAAPGSTSGAYKHPLIQYQAHVQTYGWQSAVYDGAMGGTQGESKRLEGIQIQFPGQDYSGDIQYRAHVQTYGWQDFVENGALSGTTGESKRMEAIEIQLIGEMAEHYDIYYRVHSQTYGWLDWAKNGEPAGTAGLSKRMEGIEIRLVAKGGKAPGSTEQAFIEKQ